MTLLFGRQYRLTINLYRGDSYVYGKDDNLKKPLDVQYQFEIEKRIDSIQQWATIVLYNMDPEEETDILENGFYLTVEAGYENGAYGQIFEGYIRQVIRGKFDPTTYFLKLICIDGDDALNLGLCDFVLGEGVTLRKIAQETARRSNIPFDITLSEGALSGQETTQRPTVIQGKAADKLRNLAIKDDSAFYFHNGAAKFTKLSQNPPSSIPKLNAETGLIGIPQQAGYGVSVKTLIRPDLYLDGWFHLNNQDVIMAEVSFGDLQLALPKDGYYHIIAITYRGDTRGQDWYMDIEALGHHGAVPEMLADLDQSGMQ